MEKQITLSANTNIMKKATELTRRAIELAAMPQRMLRSYYSYVLEHEVSQRQASAITEAQIAFFAFIMPADYPLLLRAVTCAWFLFALRKAHGLMSSM